MATNSRKAIHPAKNRITDAIAPTESRTKPVRNGSNSQHANTIQRNVVIQYLHAQGKTNTEISKILTIHRNTISEVLRTAPPSTPEMRDTLIRMDAKSIVKLEYALDSDNPDLWWDATKFYLSRRSILGEQAPAGTTVNVTIIEKERETKLGTGLQRYGLVRAMAAGDN